MSPTEVLRSVNEAARRGDAKRRTILRNGDPKEGYVKKQMPSSTPRRGPFKWETRFMSEGEGFSLPNERYGS